MWYVIEWIFSWNTDLFSFFWYWLFCQFAEKTAMVRSNLIHEGSTGLLILGPNRLFSERTGLK